MPVKAATVTAALAKAQKILCEGKYASGSLPGDGPFSALSKAIAPRRQFYSVQ
jgi:hypothetical protein